MHTFRCEACGGTFESDRPEAELAREEAAYADYPDAPMAEVCDLCFENLRAAFPTLDARLKLEGL